MDKSELIFFLSTKNFNKYNKLIGIGYLYCNNKELFEKLRWESYLIEKILIIKK